MKSPYSFLILSCLASVANAAVITDTVVQNKQTNWARSGTASHTPSGPGAASRAIDGNTDGRWLNNSVSHTAGTTPIGSYWQVDLGASRSIDDIQLFNRTDCCGGRLDGYSVLASNDASFSTTVFDSGTQGAAGASVNFAVGTTARYVRVVRDTIPAAGSPISLAEVQVLSDTPAYTFSNMALGSTASQSSDLINAANPTADKAIDGNLTNAFGSGSTTHTNPGAGGAVYWETTFTSLTDINEIALYNRGDCCQDRLGNFRVSIFDGATEVWGADYFVGGNLQAGDVFSVQEDTGAFIGRGDRVRVELIGGVNNASAGGDVLSLREVEIYGVAVPEPSSAALLGLGGLALILRRRK